MVFCQLCGFANHVSTRFVFGFYIALGRRRNGRDNTFTGLFWTAQYGMGRTYTPEKYGRGMARGGVWLGTNQALRAR